MKTIAFLLAMLLSGVCAHAQLSIVKTNLGAWGILSGNVTYEYRAGPNISVGSTVAYKIPSTITVDAIAEQSDGDEFRWTGDIEPTGFVATPFMRFYTKEAMKGFYVELFARYYTYTFDVPYDYDKDGGTIHATADGDASGIGGGLALGTQFYLGPAWVLDIYVGLGYAGGNAHIETSDPQLDADDFAEIKQTIEENRDTEVDIFLLGKVFDKIEADANSTSAWADIEGAGFPMLRAGICFGYAF